MLKAKWDTDKRRSRRFFSCVLVPDRRGIHAPARKQRRINPAEDRLVRLIGRCSVARSFTTGRCRPYPVHRFALNFVFLLTSLILISCAEDPIQPTPLAQEPTAIMQPTPTLIPGLPTDPPPPTIGPSPTFTPIPTPTATPPPATRIALGQAALAEGNLENCR